MAAEKVTLRDVYDAFNRLEDKQDKRLAAIEAKIDNLESFQNKALGMLAVFAAFTSAITTFIWNKVTGSA